MYYIHTAIQYALLDSLKVKGYDLLSQHISIQLISSPNLIPHIYRTESNQRALTTSVIPRQPPFTIIIANKKKKKRKVKMGEVWE